MKISVKQLRCLIQEEILERDMKLDEAYMIPTDYNEFALANKHAVKDMINPARRIVGSYDDIEERDELIKTIIDAMMHAAYDAMRSNVFMKQKKVA